MDIGNSKNYLGISLLRYINLVEDPSRLRQTLWHLQETCSVSESQEIAGLSSTSPMMIVDDDLLHETFTATAAGDLSPWIIIAFPSAQNVTFVRVHSGSLAAFASVPTRSGSMTPRPHIDEVQVLTYNQPISKARFRSTIDGATTIASLFQPCTGPVDGKRLIAGTSESYDCGDVGSGALYLAIQIGRAHV